MKSSKKPCNNFSLRPEITGWIKKAAAKFSKIEKVLVFTSRATGDYKNYSDIDITISTPEMSLDKNNQLREKILLEGKAL